MNAAGNIMQNQEALEEVKEELNKGGKGRVLFFFIIFVVNICLGKFKELYINDSVIQDVTKSITYLLLYLL